MENYDGKISMEISDNGQGFEHNENQVPKKKGQLGLVGMRERAEMIGGDFSVASAPGAPTTIRVAVPYPQTRKKSVKKSTTSRS
jgi:two-component system sensor histidine kinase NreB